MTAAAGKLHQLDSITAAPASSVAEGDGEEVALIVALGALVVDGSAPPSGSVASVIEIRPSRVILTGDTFSMYNLRTSSWVSRVAKSVFVGLL